MDLGPSSAYYQVISCSSSGSNGWLRSEFGPAPLPENCLHHRALGITASQGEEGMLGESCAVAGTAPASRGPLCNPRAVWVWWMLILGVLSTGRVVLA